MHKGFNFQVRERCRKVETVPVVEQEKGLTLVRVEDNENLFTSLNIEDFFQSMNHSDCEFRVASIILK